MSVLADDVARVLAHEPDGLSCDALAERLRRRRADVLAALRGDERFVCVGRTRGRRWLRARSAGTERDGMSAWVDVQTRLDALEARVSFLERRNGVPA